MAPFPSAVRQAMLNYMLRMDVEDLHAAYQAALVGLVHRQDEIEAYARDRLGLGPDDPWPDANQDDPDDPIGLLYDDAGEMDARAQRGAPMVRSAFLIALFHAWEKHWNMRLGHKHYARKEIEALLKADGKAEVVSIIHRLQLTANCAKHSTGDACKCLHGIDPSFFPRLRTGAAPSERSLVIEPDILEGFFAAVLSVTR